MAVGGIWGGGGGGWCDHIAMMWVGTGLEG